MKNDGVDRLEAARALFEQVAELMDLKISVRLWEDSVIPLGREVIPGLELVLSDAGVLSSLFRRPTVENVLLHYMHGNIDMQGGDMVEFASAVSGNYNKVKFRDVEKRRLWRAVWPLLRGQALHARARHRFEGGDKVRGNRKEEGKDLIQFHYDLSNDFYHLFLDPEMQYSCAYFTEAGNSLAQAQQDKLNLICRKLRLRPGEQLLDIGCGWGGLICHAARHFGVRAHGVTLSEEQLEGARERIAAHGLEDQVTVELCDYRDLKGPYDKISSIGMVEHVGIDNYLDYFRKIYTLLAPRGILLNHGISRRARDQKGRSKRVRPQEKLMLKYIFPGGELDHIGHTLECMERRRLEVHDVENLREHYAMTTRHWCERLTANFDEAAGQIGPERTRLWQAYLAGCSVAFSEGKIRIYQVVATKQTGRGLSGMPLTRRHLLEP